LGVTSIRTYKSCTCKEVREGYKGFASAQSAGGIEEYWGMKVVVI